MGSGCASFNSADTLYKLGEKDICIVTEGINMGTSRNTGSDKQTYYKQSTNLKDLDSPYKMAKTLFSGGGMHGDISLIEASQSLKSFYKLLNIGVNFPSDEYGVYVGYKTDHDENSRASSIGPLTSKIMTEQLEKEVNKNGIDIFNKYLVVSILKDENENAIGLLTINLSDINEKDFGLTIFNSTNIIYGTGGPASIYDKSVYPKNHFGASGIPILAGCTAHNFTEWQYGIASIKFPWNLSGTYQQVLPRYISIDEEGNEIEFLEEYFENKRKLLSNIFLKGYQWPFDPRKANDSSSIDLLVYIETQIKGRKVYLDYTKNPKSLINNGNIDFSILDKVSYDYLKNSEGLLDTPIERLKKMNPLAIDLYSNHNIDITKEYLEIDVCSQHQNGGIKGNIWWETNIKHLFVVGEVCGSLGIYRPGGTALNSTQVGSSRAATYIKNVYNNEPLDLNKFKDITNSQIIEKLNFITDIKITDDSNIHIIRKKCQILLSKIGSFIRNKDDIEKGILELENIYNEFTNIVKIDNISLLPKVMRTFDMLVSQIALLVSIKNYIDAGGDSRGSYLIIDDKGKYSFETQSFKCRYNLSNNLLNKVLEIKLNSNKNLDFKTEWVETRAIPENDGWFEKVWDDFRQNKIYGGKL